MAGKQKQCGFYNTWSGELRGKYFLRFSLKYPTSATPPTAVIPIREAGGTGSATPGGQQCMEYPRSELRDTPHIGKALISASQRQK
jgi:hypothetical protein